MRVLIIGPILPYLGGRTTGGVAMDCTNQAIYLKKNNVEVAIIAHNTFSNQKYRQYKGINIYYFPLEIVFIIQALYNLFFSNLFKKVMKFTGIKGIFKAFKMLGRMYSVKYVIKEFRPDIIHIHDIDYLLEVELVNTNKIPIITTIHSLSALNILYTNKNEIVVNNRIYKKVIPRLKYAVTVSKYLKREIREKYKKEVDVINNPVSVILETNKGTKFYKNKKYSNKKVLVFIGHLKKGKGVYDLIKVVDLLKHKLDFHLIIIGEGKEKNNLVKEIKNNKLEKLITLIGKIPHRDVFKYLSISDLFITCSYGETWGNVLFEAFSKGVPVVAYDNTVMREVIPNYAGLLAEDRDVEDFARKVLCALNTNWNRKKIKKYAFEHSWEKRITDFINYFKYVLGNEDYLKEKRCKS